jgi:GTP-binding protein YchF
MKLGLVGLPNVGKTTLFNALTRSHAVISGYTAAEANRGIISVPDARLDELHARLQTPKIVYATVEVVDIPGMGAGPAAGAAGPSGGLGSRFLADIRSVDAVAHVLRAFENPDVPHTHEGLDPIGDAELVETELVLSDLEIVERRMQKSAKAAKSGDRAAQKEMALLDRLAAALRAGGRARSVERAPEDEPLLRDLALLSERPVLFVLNTGDEGGQSGGDLVAWARARGDEVVAVPARLEAELAELDADEAAIFREELGGAEPSIDRFIGAAYDVLGYISFYTGDYRSSETRAWQLPRGSSAKQAAGRIHTDIQRGFVRAEVVPLPALLEHGSFHAAREKGALRVEGKDYVVQDADVINFRHTG